MKTSYNILWIDDDPENTQPDQIDVKEFLEEFGIRGVIAFVKAPPDGSIHDRIKDNLSNPELDILIVDYHMNGLSGDELVRLIRKTDYVYLPVIFYSSSPEEEIFDAVCTKRLDGVYIANRRFLMDKFKDVVKSLLNKEQTTKQTRGLLMEGVSELDARLEQIFLQAWRKLKNDDKLTLVKYLKDIISKRSRSAQQKADEFPGEVSVFTTHMTEAFLSSEYDTKTRWKIVKKMLKLLDIDNDKQKTLHDFARDGDSEFQSLNSIRNDYAHKTRKALEDEHDEGKCIEIRRELRRQQTNIDRIVEKIV